MEDTAYQQAWTFAWIFHFIIIVCSICQYACFHFYNEEYHPMVKILEESKQRGRYKTFEGK